jgi:hypothetical protein
MSLKQFENELNLTTETMKYYCTIGFYTLLAFQRHKVFKIWMHGLKDMNFESFQIFEFYLNQTKPGFDTWRLMIRRYRFVSITNTERWILSDLGG